MVCNITVMTQMLAFVSSDTMTSQPVNKDLSLIDLYFITVY